MTEFLILLSTPGAVKDFVFIVNQYPFDVDLVSGRYVVDAKSIMGIFSLNLNKPVALRIQSDDCDELCERLKCFRVNEENES